MSFYRLCLLRHAHALTAPGQPDPERPLSEQGERGALAVGAAMMQAAVRPDLALVSTARRTRTTWQGVQKQLPDLVPALFEERLYNASADDILACIQAINTANLHHPTTEAAGAKSHSSEATPASLTTGTKAWRKTGHCLLVLGHNPGLHQLALQLITQAAQLELSRLHQGLVPGGLIIVDFPELPGWHALAQEQQYAGVLHRYLLPEDRY